MAITEDYVGQTKMSVWDFCAIAVYFLLMICTGLYSMYKSRKTQGSVAEFFLAGRFMWWLPVGASLFASNIGSEHFIGLAGSGAASGIMVGAFELNALIALQALSWIFLPVYIASGVSTLPEYMHKRYGGKRIQICLAVLSVLLYIFTKISINMYTGAIFIQEGFGWSNIYFSVVVLLILTALLTIAGGLRAVMYTDTLQFFIMILGSFIVAYKAFSLVGGYDAMYTKYMEAIPDKLVPNTTCGIPTKDSWVMLRDPLGSDLPWPGFIFGQSLSTIWHWCTDQMMVQRVLTAKSLSHAQGGTIFAGFAKILPLFLIIFPGMIARILFTNEIGCADPMECQKFCGANTCTNFAYPKLVFTYMPSGMRGVMLAVVLSALVSDLTSIFNSASTLFTIDLWTHFRPRASQKEKVFVGRAFVLVLVVLSILWIPIMEQVQGGQLYLYARSVSAYLAPSISAVFCLAISVKQVNETGAFWSLILGFGVGIIRMIIDFYYRAPLCFEEDTRPGILSNFHYMYFALFLFCFTSAVAIIISKLTEPIEEWKLIRTMYVTRYDKRERKDDIEMREEQSKKMELMEQEMQAPDREKRKENKKQKMSWLANYFQDDSVDLENVEMMKMNEHLSKLANLDQKPWEKYLLNSMLVVILATAVALYVIYSINPFTEEEIQLIQDNKIRQIMNFTSVNKNAELESIITDKIQR